MKVLFLVLGFIMLNSPSFAQGNDIMNTRGQGVDSCYFKQKRAIQNRFADWECGKLAGVIDCNEELEYDEGSNTVFKKAKDNVMIQGVGKPFSGTCETCHMNGLLQRRVTFLNGKEDGIDTTFYQTGCPQVVRSFIKGVESGKWEYYYDSTMQLAWEMNYYLGEKQGPQVYMKPNGDTTKVETYQQGLLHGPKITYYEDSKVKKEVNYVGGFLDGKSTFYSPEGIVLDEVNYKHGKKDGNAKYYYEDGVLLRTENWQVGVKNGEFKTFYYQGHLQTLESYTNGKRDGKFQEYYYDQTPKRIAVYKNDELMEDHHYDEDGSETYSFGKPTSTSEDDEVPGKSKKKKSKD